MGLYAAVSYGVFDAPVSTVTKADVERQHAQAIEQMLSEQVEALDPDGECVESNPSFVPSSALVRSNERNTGVVYRASFEEAYKGAEAGKVWVLRLCK